MDLIAAIALSVVFVGISAGVGAYLLRFRASITEMMGMMVGMTMGMMVGIAVGFYIGAATSMFISNLAGVAVGLVFGAAFGRAGGLMGAMDGSMGGFMGGMMGAMLGVMVNTAPLPVWVTAGFTTLVCLTIYAALIRLVQQASVTRFARDPVCNMTIDIATANLTSEFHDEIVYFCSTNCRNSFEQDPVAQLVKALRHRPFPQASSPE